MVPRRGVAPFCACSATSSESCSPRSPIGLGLIAVYSALAGGGAWVIALAAAALALWMADLARRALVRRRI